MQMIQFLVGRAAMLDCQDNLKDTPLHLAADEGQAAAVSLLLSLGADRTIKNAAGKTAEDLAKDENTRAAYKVKTRNRQQLITAVRRRRKRTASGKLKDESIVREQ